METVLAASTYLNAASDMGGYIQRKGRDGNGARTGRYETLAATQNTL